MGLRAPVGQQNWGQREYAEGWELGGPAGDAPAGMWGHLGGTQPEHGVPNCGVPNGTLILPVAPMSRHHRPCASVSLICPYNHSPWPWANSMGLYPVQPGKVKARACFKDYYEKQSKW